MPTATCLCGKCHMIVDTNAVFGTSLCHCLNCRKMSSSAYTINTAMPSKALQLVRGEPKVYTITGDTGAEADMFFCGDCGSSLWTEYKPLPDQRVLKAGVLDGQESLAAEAIGLKAEQWTCRRPGWQKACERTAQVEEQLTAGQIKKFREEGSVE